MGRKDTKAVKSINRMYEQMNLDSSEILHKTKLLLGVYRDVVWATLYEADAVHEDIYYFGSELKDALMYLEEFAPDTEKAEFEANASLFFSSKILHTFFATKHRKEDVYVSSCKKRR